jgi:protoporphyrinogen oxidase
LSRIYYRGKYYAYPLKLLNALVNLGSYEAARIMLSYAKWQVFPHLAEESFEQWVMNRFGGRLYWHFFRTYTEKVWGVFCNVITADWAAQRIKNLSLSKAVWNSISGANDTASLIEQFEYPRLGPGMMWEKCRDLICKRGGEVRVNAPVTRFIRTGNRIESIEVTQPSGTERMLADEFISTMPLADLIACIAPQPPEKVCAAAKRLKYRDFLIVVLILDHPDPFPDNWIYVHSAEVKVGRIQNFRAWSPNMVPHPEKSSVGLEYFCHAEDALWTASDAYLIALAADELDFLGLASKSTVIDGVVMRQQKAYPVYDDGCSKAVGVIKRWLGTLQNLQTVGRNGLHRYNNQDHSMLTAMLAVRNLAREQHDVWNVNVERSYQEEFKTLVAPQSAVALDLHFNA